MWQSFLSSKPAYVDGYAANLQIFKRFFERVSECEGRETLHAYDIVFKYVALIPVIFEKVSANENSYTTFLK